MTDRAARRASPARLRQPVGHAPASRTVGLSAVAQPDARRASAPAALPGKRSSETLKRRVPLDDVLDELSPAARPVDARRGARPRHLHRHLPPPRHHRQRLARTAQQGPARRAPPSSPRHRRGADPVSRRARSCGRRHRRVELAQGRLQAQTCRWTDQRGAEAGRPGARRDPENPPMRSSIRRTGSRSAGSRNTARTSPGGSRRRIAPPLPSISR